MGQLAPTENDIETALRGFALAVLPAGIEVFRAQENRVPEPASNNFMLFTPIRRRRLATNRDEYVDCAFTASIADNVLTVSAVAFGTIILGRTLLGVGITANTKILAQLSGTPGGIGTYQLDLGDQTVSSEKMAAGVVDMVAATELCYQLDFHGPAGGDNAQMFSTTFRDLWGVDFFTRNYPDVAEPLHADEPRQMPFINAEQQYEDRWTLEATLQADQVYEVTQEFADQVQIARKPVDIIYPAAA